MTATIRAEDEKIGAALRAAGYPGLAHGFGPYTAKREADALALRAQAIEALAQDVAKMREFVRFVWDAAHGDYAKPRTMDDLRDVIANYADEDALFETCDACGGAVDVVDEIPDEFGTQRHRGECSSCVGGRVPR